VIARNDDAVRCSSRSFLAESPCRHLDRLLTFPFIALVASPGRANFADCFPHLELSIASEELDL
jgi:hypothetical protein